MSPGNDRAKQALKTGSQLAFFLGVILVSVLSLVPSTALPPIAASDKLSHALAYCSLSLTGGIGFPGRTLLLLFGLLGLGAALEGLQMLVPGRFAETADLLANGIGIVVGLAAVSLSGRWRAKAESSVAGHGSAVSKGLR